MEYSPANGGRASKYLQQASGRQHLSDCASELQIIEDKAQGMCRRDSLQIRNLSVIAEI